MTTLTNPTRVRVLGLFSVVSAAGLALTATTAAQPAAQSGAPAPNLDRPTLPSLQSEDIAIQIDSGNVPSNGERGEPQVVFVTAVRVPDAPWLRLNFDTLVLAGDPAADGAFLRLTSALDHGRQILNAESAAQWHNTSAYFNGDTVFVELLAYPGTGESRIAMSRVTVGLGGFHDRTICGPTDDRTLSTDNRQGRQLPDGCTAWMFNDTNGMFLAAGHCGISASDVVQFNVPLSTSTGGLVNPPPQDQYVVETASIQFTYNTIGDDWSYFGVTANSTTGLTPFQAYGVRYTRAATAPNVSGQTLRITGYGVVDAPVSPTWNQVQKTHAGPYTSKSGTVLQYQVDTTGGNSGSCIFNLADNTAIGIHTNAGCGTGGGANSGTAINNAGLQTAINNPTGVCKTGKGGVSGRVFAIGDSANNFGTVHSGTGAFGRLSAPIATPQGLAYNPFLGVFYAVDSSRNMYAINPATGAGTLLGTVTGTTATLNGLAYSPRLRTLFVVAQATGQLYTISLGSLAATSVGPARGGTVGGLEVGPAPAYEIYGLNDSGGTKLIKISAADGSQTVVGTLGAGITDCNGLAFNPADGQFYTINAANEQALRVNPSTGVAAVVGGTNGFFGASFGMAGQIDPPACPPDVDGDGFVTGQDFDQYVAAFEAGDGSADYNADGFVSGEDFDAFTAAFEMGC